MMNLTESVALYLIRDENSGSLIGATSVEPTGILSPENVFTSSESSLLTAKLSVAGTFCAETIPTFIHANITKRYTICFKNTIFVAKFLIKIIDKGKHSLQMNKLWYILCFPFLFFLQNKVIFAQNHQGSVFKKVVIDPGHGGKDPGAIGATTKEKDIVLDISLRLGKMINDKYPDVEVVYTRKTDVYLDPYKRSDIANNANADFFISIHTNSMKDTKKCASVFGTETFVMGNDKSAANMESVMRENSVILFEDDLTRYEGFDPTKPELYIIFSMMQNLHLKNSIDFADEIQKQFKSAKRTDRGVKQGLIYVLWKTSMPSVLIELGFICNPEEEKYMNSATGKNQLTTAIFQAFSSYKANFEDRSSFRPAVDAGAGTKPESPARQTQPPARQSQTPTAQPSTQVNITPVPAASKKVEFCVQIQTSSRPIDTTPNNFKNHKNVERFQTAPANFKYIVGRTTDYATAQETLKRVRNDYSDAFMVCIVDGKIIPLAEGRKLLNE